MARVRYWLSFCEKNIDSPYTITASDVKIERTSLPSLSHAFGIQVREPQEPDHPSMLKITPMVRQI